MSEEEEKTYPRKPFEYNDAGELGDEGYTIVHGNVFDRPLLITKDNGEIPPLLAKDDDADSGE